MSLPENFITEVTLVKKDGETLVLLHMGDKFVVCSARHQMQALLIGGGIYAALREEAQAAMWQLPANNDGGEPTSFTSCPIEGGIYEVCA